MVAVGGSIGATVTRSQFVDNGVEIAGSVESYVTPRVSIRGQIGTAWWDIVGLSYAGTLQPVVFHFFNRDTTLTGEGLFHNVGRVPTNRATLGFKGSFWSFAVGAKKYF